MSSANTKPEPLPSPHAEPPGPPWLGAVLHRTQLDIRWFVVTLILLGVGLVFFGWRGMACVCITALATLASFLLVSLLIRIVLPRRANDSSLHALVLGLLLGLAMQPMHEATVLLLSGLLLGIITPLIGRARRLRINPVAMVVVLVWLMPAIMGNPEIITSKSPHQGAISAVLRPDRLILGDLRDQRDQFGRGPWWTLNEYDGADAATRPDPAVMMLSNRWNILRQDGLLESMLQSGELCRLEEVLIGCTAGPIGGTSKALLIIVGVYLMYRRLASWQTAAAAFATAVLVLLLMPISVNGQLTLVGLRFLQLPSAVAITYVSYFLLTSPLIYIAMILAPITAPMSSRGQMVYGFTIGGVAVAGLWSFGVPQAAFLALVIASALSRPLDVMKRSPFVE